MYKRQFLPPLKLPHKRIGTIFAQQTFYRKSSITDFLNMSYVKGYLRNVSRLLIRRRQVNYSILHWKLQIIPFCEAMDAITILRQADGARDRVSCPSHSAMSTIFFGFWSDMCL